MTDEAEEPKQLGLEFNFSSGKMLLVYGSSYDLSTVQNQQTIMQNFGRNTFPVLMGLDGRPVLINMAQVTNIRVVVVK